MTEHKLVERLQLHSTWRDSHGELNDAPNEAAAEIERLLTKLEGLTDCLTMWRGLVQEGGVPRYTVLPGAALNTLVGWTDQELRKEATPHV